MVDITEDRLGRIEDKLDKMSEAIVSLARMEERMITLFRRMDTYDAQQVAIEARVVTVEIAHAKNSWVERVAWIVVGAIVTTGIGLLLLSFK